MERTTDRRSRHVILFAIGSAGDVHPFIGLGKALRARGHRVTVVSNGHFEPLIRRVGFDYFEVGTEEDYRNIIENPDLWDARNGFKLVAEYAIVLQMRPIYEMIRDRYVPGETVLAAPVTAIGARIAQEHLGVPLVTVCLQPSVLPSMIDPPIYAGLPMSRRMPRWWNLMWYHLADAIMIRRLIGRPANAFRAELGLPPINEPILSWWLSPTRILGVFPEWFTPRPPDWPSQLRLTSFPLYDESDAGEIPEDVAAFLDAGPPPIIFTPGSAMKHGDAFFASAVDACARMGRRGMLLTKFRDHLPDNLPDTIRAFPFVPFSQVFPRAAAVVHHGGVGTMAQALKGGIPQLIMPMAHDQFDNASRIERLGVGTSLVPHRFRGPKVAEVLKRLIDDPVMADRCRIVADRLRSATSALDDSCEIIEEAASVVHEHKTSHAPLTRQHV